MKAQPNRQLAVMLMEVLELDSLRDATKILKSIFFSIKQALLRGERVYVRGFGTFRVIDRTHRPTPNNILTNDHNGIPMAYAAGLLRYKPRRVVVFEPSIALMGMLNLDSPNYKERRSQQSWGTEV